MKPGLTRFQILIVLGFHTSEMLNQRIPNRAWQHSITIFVSLT